MPKRYPDEVEDRAARMVREHQGDYSLITATCGAVGPRLGIPDDTLRRWVDQARIGEGDKPGIMIAESEEISALKKENRRPGEENEIRRASSIRRCRSSRASRGSSTRTNADLRVHRRDEGKGVRGRVGLRGAA